MEEKKRIIGFEETVALEMEHAGCSLKENVDRAISRADYERAREWWSIWRCWRKMELRDIWESVDDQDV